MVVMSFFRLLVLAALLRLAMLLYGEWQDATMLVKYSAYTFLPSESPYQSTLLYC